MSVVSGSPRSELAAPAISQAPKCDAAKTYGPGPARARSSSGGRRLPEPDGRDEVLRPRGGRQQEELEERAAEVAERRLGDRRGIGRRRIVAVREPHVVEHDARGAS